MSLRTVQTILLLLLAIPPLKAHADDGVPALGFRHTCALRQDGTVACWGNNAKGQLGQGDYVPRQSPTVVPGLSGVIALTAGGEHTCAVRQGGAVVCWGDNTYGQLGLGSLGGDRPNPVDVSAAGNVTELVAGSGHTCARYGTVAVRCWGRNTYGQLGLGTTSHTATPTAVPLGTNGIATLAAGGQHTCVRLLPGNSVSCWGWNSDGQLGLGSTGGFKSSPTAVPGLASGVAALTAGLFHTCARLQAGGLKCWGYNQFGQIGVGSFATTVPTPTSIGVPGSIKSVVAGGHHTCAIQQDDALRCWGYNEDGELGVGDNQNRPSPMLVTGFGGGGVSPVAAVAAVAAGGFHTCAQRQSGDLACWGSNERGQTASGSTVWALAQPGGNAAGVANAATVAAGGNFSCAVRQSGSVDCWGGNYAGQLGVGYDDHPLPAPLPVLGETVSTMDSGWGFACAIRQNGDVICWGDNQRGQLGVGNTQVQSGPVTGFGGATRVATGDEHACAILVGGAVRCWGSNSWGQLGLGAGAATVVPTPTLVAVSDAIAIAAGSAHTCAVTTNAVWCWGANDHGQLGTGETSYRPDPTEVQGLVNPVTMLAAGGSHTCALEQGGSVVCWGWNGGGQLGDSSFIDSYVPVPVSNLGSGVIAISAGQNHTCALKQNGTVSCWGENTESFGQLTAHSVPVAVPGLADAVAISAGEDHTCAVRQSGAVVCWGYNYNGQLGIGVMGYARTPEDVDHLLRDGFQLASP